MTEKETEQFVKKLWKNGKNFYKTYAWKRFRKRVLAKKKNRCELCWNYGISGKEVRKFKRATVLHHKKHLKDRPDLALSESNMEALCAACHELRHPERKKKFNPFISKNPKERWD